MSIEKPGNERLELYETFRKALKEGNEDEFFDADDLVAIIDQAVDLNDDYVQLEALMRGYRYFADNEELAVRRGFLFYDLDIKEGAEDMANHPAGNSPLWTLLRIRAKADTINPERARKVLEKLIARTDKFDDEAIIQLVDCASACGLYDWLKENEKLLRTKCDYLSALLYELHIAATTRADMDYAIELLEELTEIEPFSLDFWLALAQECVTVSRSDEALIATDYAIAIDSENLAAIALKGTALLQLARFAEAELTMQPFVEKAMTDETPLTDLYARALLGLDRREQAIEVLTERATQKPDDATVFDLLLRLKVPEAEQLLRLHYGAVGGGRELLDEWIQRANDYYNQGEYFASAKMFSLPYDERILPREHYAAYYSALYVSGDYAECIEWLDDFLRNRPSQLTPDICVAGLLSMVRLGNYDGAAAAIRSLERLFPLKVRTQWHISSTLTSVGFSTFLNMLGTMLKQPDMFEIDAIDLFTPPMSSERYENPEE